eukprot:jgi/Ulvmu1/2219/UM013_0065.1
MRLVMDSGAGPSGERDGRAELEAVDSIISMIAAQGLRTDLWRSFLNYLRSMPDGTQFSSMCQTLQRIVTPQMDAGAPWPPGRFVLKMEHNCDAHGCRDNACRLCINSNFKLCPNEEVLKTKFVTQESLRAACGALPLVRIVRTESESSPPTMDEWQKRRIPPFKLQVIMLPKKYYDKKKEHIPWNACITDQSGMITTSVKPELVNGNRKQKAKGKQAAGAASHSASQPATSVPCSPSQGTSILYRKDGASQQEDDGRISFPGLEDHQFTSELPKRLLSPDGVTFPDIAVSRGCSGEAVLGLTSKRPHMVMMVYAVDIENGHPLKCIRPAVSSSFHVATPKTNENPKPDIPFTNEPVSVLHNIGDACVSKLAGSEKQADASDQNKQQQKQKKKTASLLQELVAPPFSVPLPDAIKTQGVRSVGDMRTLLHAVAACRSSDAATRRLQTSLSLNMVMGKDGTQDRDKFKELEAQVERAVPLDTRLRVFYCGAYPTVPLRGLDPRFDGFVDCGLVFACEHLHRRNGSVDLSTAGIRGVVVRTHMVNPHSGVEMVVPDDCLEQEPKLQDLLHMHAQVAWRVNFKKEKDTLLHRHPGWGIYAGRDGDGKMPEPGVPYRTDSRRPMSYCPEEYLPTIASSASASTSAGMAELHACVEGAPQAHPGAVAEHVGAVMAAGGAGGGGAAPAAAAAVDHLQLERPHQAGEKRRRAVEGQAAGVSPRISNQRRRINTVDLEAGAAATGSTAAEEREALRNETAPEDGLNLELDELHDPEGPAVGLFGELRNDGDRAQNEAFAEALAQVDGGEYES